MDMPVEKKESRTGAIIGTVIAIALCGLPVFCLCPLSIWIFSGTFVGAMTGYSGDNISATWGILPLCLSVIGILVAVLVPVLTLRKKKPAVPPVEVLPPQEPPPPQEPLPPAS